LINYVHARLFNDDVSVTDDSTEYDMTFVDTGQAISWRAATMGYWKSLWL